MTDDLEFDVLDYNMSSGGLVKHVGAAYETSVEDGEVRINYQGKKEKSVGDDEAIYAVENAGLGSPEEYMVTVSLAEAGVGEDPLEAVERVAESVLGSHAETDDGEQWAVGALD